MAPSQVPLYDCVVLGVGSMGSSAAYHLAARGLKVLGIEQFDVLHTQGAHSGHTRIIRKAYFEQPDYIPLLQRAYANWSKLEALCGEKVYYPTGLLYAAPKGDPLIEQVKSSAALYRIPLQVLTATDCAARFPQFRIPENFEIVLEPEAGFLDVGKAITQYAKAAVQAGAEIRIGEKVLNWKQEDGLITVQTDKGRYTGKKLVITAGPWSADLIPGIKEKLTITRQVLSWMQPDTPEQYTTDRFPCWMIVKPGTPGSYYGFPAMRPGEVGGPAGIKVALHHPGQSTTASTIDRTIHPEDLDHLVSFAQDYLPGAGTVVTDTATCMYSNSPDEHFIIDHLPGTEKQVTVAWGFSGHGFKFVSVVGEVLADLVVDGRTELDIDFLRMGRLG